MSRRALLAVLLALSAILYFVDLGGTSIWDANEAFYVETPREMIEAHDFVNPSFNYEPRFNKPVLSYWVVAAFYGALGVSVGVQRLPIALGALVLVACAFRLARAAAPGGHGSGAAALWAAAGLAASPRLLMFARRIFIDVWISAFMGLTLLCFALSERHPAHRRKYLLLMYVAVGLGTLTKGPEAILLPGLVFAVYLIVHGELRRVTQMRLPAGALIVAAIVVPWYALLYHQHGWTYIRAFFVGENLERYTTGAGFQQSRGVLFYLPVVFSDAFPWSFFLIAAAVVWWAGRRTRRDPHGARRIQTLLWIWIVAIVGFFSLSASKQDLYVLPIVPAVAALGGMAIASGLGAWAPRSTRPAAFAGSGDPASRAPGWVRWTASAIAIALVACGGAILYLFQAAGRVYALEGALAIGIAGVAGGVLSLAFAIGRRPAASLLAVLGTLAALNWTFVVRVLPDFERYKPVPELSDAILSRATSGATVAEYQVALPSFVYYLRRHVDMYQDEPSLARLLESGGPAYVVLTASAYDAIRPHVAARTCVLDRQATFDVKLIHVLRRQPPPELLLISNACGGG